MKVHVFFNIQQNNLLLIYLFTLFHPYNCPHMRNLLALENAFFVTWNIGKCL